MREQFSQRDLYKKEVIEVEHKESIRKAKRVLEMIEEMNKIEDCSGRFFYQAIVEGKIVLLLHEELYSEFEPTLSKDNQKVMREAIIEIHRIQFEPK